MTTEQLLILGRYLDGANALYYEERGKHVISTPYETIEYGSLKDMFEDIEYTMNEWRIQDDKRTV